MVMKQLHNAQLDAVRFQILENVVKDLRQQLEEMKIKNAKGELVIQNFQWSILKEPKISMLDKFHGKIQS